MKRSIRLALLIAAIAGPVEAQEFLRFTSVELRIGGWDDAATITRENLMEARSFILARGYRETFGSAYNDNPAHRTKGHGFYLIPDRGQNTDCDPEVCGFHSLYIRKATADWDSSRGVDFSQAGQVLLRTGTVRDDLTVGQIQNFVVDAMREILGEIDGRRPPSLAPPASRTLEINLGRQDPRWDDGTILRHENLLRIHHLLREQGHQDQPGFSYSLDPDAAGGRCDEDTEDCDVSASYHLAIRPAGDQIPTIHVDFSDHRWILLRVRDPSDDLAAGEILQSVVDAMVEILTEGGDE